MKVLKSKKGKDGQARETSQSDEQQTNFSGITHEVMPHPYHASTPPPQPSFSKFENRFSSLNSHVSDVSMDEQSGTHESVFDYSDTSGEEREDAYFLPRNQTGRMGNLLGNSIDSVGESTFRDLRLSGSKSSRVLKYSSDGSIEILNDDEDNDDENKESNYFPFKSWMTSIAYSIRSPQDDVPYQKKDSKSNNHRSQPSWATMEYPSNLMNPFTTSLHQSPYATVPGAERAPLLAEETKSQSAYGSQLNPERGFRSRNIRPSEGSKIEAQPRPTTLKSKTTAATIAACFLMDYEAGRPPTLPLNFESISQQQLRVYKLHFSWMWRIFGNALPIVVLFLAHSQTSLITAVMHSYAIAFFLVEVWMREKLYSLDQSGDFYHPERRLNSPLVLFLIVLGLESWIWYIFPPDPYAKVPALISSAFKPIVFFYVSLKARHALEGLSRITRTVLRVIMIEMMVILAFAAVGSQLFHDYDSFRHLSTSWISLFELSTTVVNPSLWMPMYEVSRTNAIFFIFFIIVSVFYLHSLVLSVVFQTYISAATDIHSRSAMDREEAIRRAFIALLREESLEFISASSIRKTLQIVRPHYSAMKIKALMDIVDPSDQHAIDYPTFRAKIRQALNASIRTARSNSNFAMLIELLATVIAVSNFVYVLLMTSSFSAGWLDSIRISAGSIITICGVFELIVRFNPNRLSNFTPITRLNPTFDGLALIGSLVSLYGIFGSLFGAEDSVDYLMTGRAIDTIRMMRFFPMFRDVVRRSSDVIPAMTGPFLCMLTTIHIFVSLGMAFWGDAIDEEILAKNENLTHLYYLNNFNSYTQGLVTIFNILVVNDWHAIAQVYFYADRCFSPFIVYPFFVITICCAVFIMVNVITAFFVESFVHDEENHPGRIATDFNIKTGETATLRSLTSARGLKDLSEPTDDEPFEPSEETSTKSETNTVFAFDVYEREGFDQIMRTVVGGTTTEEVEAFARSVCDYLEVFESLTPGREKVGYMLCCQQSLNRFGNRRFQNSASKYMQPDVLQKVIDEMHAELLVLMSRRKFENRCLVRSFRHPSDNSLILEIAASLLRQQPAVSLLVSRVRSIHGEEEK